MAIKFKLSFCIMILQGNILNHTSSAFTLVPSFKVAVEVCLMEFPFIIG